MDQLRVTPLILSPATWRGQHLLGVTLQQVRRLSGEKKDDTLSTTLYLLRPTHLTTSPLRLQVSLHRTPSRPLFLPTDLV